MIDVVLLDAGPLGMASHPRPDGAILTWLTRLLSSGIEVVVPEIADYEVRRELLRAGLNRSLERLDELIATLGFLPITREAMLKAAEIWAETRRKGRPTAAEKRLDADAILAGQAAMLTGKRVVVATGNTKHLARLVTAKNWQDITI